MVQIISTIKSNPLGKWYIQLSDTIEEDNIEICLDINEYSKKIETIGALYDYDIEVIWESEQNVTPAQINEVRHQIMQYEEENKKENI